MEIIDFHHPLWEEISPLIQTGQIVSSYRGIRVWDFPDPATRLSRNRGLDEAMVHRDQCVRRYGYSIPAPHVLEMGAGMGYWAYLLGQLGVWVDAFDEEPWPVPFHFWHPVQPGTPSVLSQFPDHVLFLCWPSYEGQWAEECLDTYAGDQLMLVAEKGCCATEYFYHRLDREWELVDGGPNYTWNFIKDGFYFYKRKKK